MSRSWCEVQVPHSYTWHVSITFKYEYLRHFVIFYFAEGFSYPGLHADHTLGAPWSFHRAGGWGSDRGPWGEWWARDLDGRGVGKRWRRRRWSCGDDFCHLLLLLPLLLDGLTSSWWIISGQRTGFHWVPLSFNALHIILHPEIGWKISFCCLNINSLVEFTNIPWVSLRI